jgi:hypothetical protein
VKKLDVPQSGSQADTTASRNRFGQYNRTRAQPVQPRTAAQVAVRGYLTDATQAWRELTDEARAGWNAYASEQPKLDSLGQTIFLTGHQTFVAMWISLTQAALATPPAVPTEAPQPPPPAEVSALDTTPTFDIGISTAPTVVNKLLIFASPQVSAGRTFNGDYRFIQRATAAVGGIVNIASNYSTKYGALILGRKIFLRCVTVTAAGGVSAPTEFSGIVAAP